MAGTPVRMEDHVQHMPILSSHLCCTTALYDADLVLRSASMMADEVGRAPTMPSSSMKSNFRPWQH